MKKRFLYIGIAVVLIGVGVYLGITLSEPPIPYDYQPPEYDYLPPEKINDGLDVGTLDEVNIDSELIEEAVSEINSGKYGEVHSMLVFKDGKLVLEEYFRGHRWVWDAANYRGRFVTWDRDMIHHTMSVSKSVVSTCIGIAVDEGFIESVHQSIFDYLPEHQHLNTDGKDEITIEHLLTMTSGLQWDEWSASLQSTANDIIDLAVNCKGEIACVLEKPLVHEPGTNFTYSGGNMAVLGEIIRYDTGMNVHGFSTQYLFEPLGIDYSRWSRWGSGVFDTAGGLEITPRDMTKIGVTFLDDGVWDGQQIVSEQWVEKSATTFAGNTGINVPDSSSGRRGYSYTWWTKQYSESGKEVDMFFASGWGGQEIMVLSEVNTVIVFTGGVYTGTVKTFRILEDYLIPALIES